MAQLSAFALDRDNVLVGKDDGLYRRDAKESLMQVDATSYGSAISVDDAGIDQVRTIAEVLLTHDCRDLRAGRARELRQRLDPT